MSTLDDMFEVARDLIGDSASSNPEYARGIMELIAHFMPGDYEAAREYVHHTVALFE
ncbi:hypothetical protein AB0346_00400 [Nocardia beijingensis]|uniref:hypothetical protein n=1 Tax=Nocardia beijingensis TaxID=95162 RepID=UPI00344E4DEC